MKLWTPFAPAHPWEANLRKESSLGNKIRKSHSWATEWQLDFSPLSCTGQAVSLIVWHRHICPHVTPDISEISHSTMHLPRAARTYPPFSGCDYTSSVASETAYVQETTTTKQPKKPQQKTTPNKQTPSGLFALDAKNSKWKNFEIKKISWPYFLTLLKWRKKAA